MCGAELLSCEGWFGLGLGCWGLLSPPETRSLLKENSLPGPLMQVTLEVSGPPSLAGFWEVMARLQVGALM